MTDDCDPNVHFCSQSKVTSVQVTVGIEATIYCVFLSFVIYMTYAFLIKMKNYRFCHLTIFYILAIMILVLRIAEFVLYAVKSPMELNNDTMRVPVTERI